MPTRQTWKTKIRGVLRLFNSSSAKAARNEELEFTPSATYSDDSEDYYSDDDELEGGKKLRKKGPLIIKPVLQECYECGKLRTINWCKNCESKDFIKKFSKWSSKNDLLDKFIRNTQYKAYSHRYYWEWIPFEKFSNIQFLSNGGQSNVYTAIWLEGPRNLWDNENFMFVRRKLCKVILKRLPYAPNNITPEFINELRKYYGHQRSRCSRIVQIYGLTLDPKSGRYMLVTAYHNKLDVRTLLKESSDFSWSDRLRLLQDCAEALSDIHSKGHVHKNIHPGNLLLHTRGKNIFLNISDLGLCNYNKNNNNNNNNNHNNKNNNNNSYNNSNDEILGIIPYVAPEIFNCWPYTQDSDIYSFSMLMFELATDRPPFYDRAHDQHLIFDICEGLRPKFDFNEIPECYADLMKQCWDTEPVSRPSANEILITVKSWNFDDFLDKKFNDQDFDIHPDAIYTSRPLGELISRELELQDQAWEKTELHKQDNYKQDNEMEGSSSALEEDEEDEEDEDDEDEDDEDDDEDDDDDEDEDEDDDEEKSDDDDERVTNTEHGDDNSNSEQLVESKTNEFQLKLELNFGSSSDLTKINEMVNQNKSNERVDDGDNNDDESSSNNTTSPNTSVFDDSLTESSSNNATSPNTSVFDEESKHEDDTSN